ncbi:MAG TPA: response regulator transcription factor [Stellaceae bacterium]|nr:response regulator transcription factor [Stellaceae bacterium]
MGRFDRSDLDLSAASESDTALAAAASAVAIIDRSRLRRECLKVALAQHNPHWHIAEFATADELLRIVAASEQFDLVLIGAATAEHVDLAQLERVREAQPETPLVVVAENGSPQRARAILGAGARGFLPASLSLKVLMGALDLVLAGGVYVPSSLIEAPSRQMGEGGVEAPSEPWSELTRRQRDVLGLISQGKSNKLIADALSMSESTVKAHVKQIIKRLHVSNRTQAALLATGHGFYGPAIGLAHNGHSNGHHLHGMAHEMIAAK